MPYILWECRTLQIVKKKKKKKKNQGQKAETG